MSEPAKEAPAPAAMVYYMPPFPPVPPGVTLIPFKDFKEHGIQIFGDDDEVEIDGLGIPTVELRVPHETDECKTETRRKKRKGPKDDPDNEEAKKRKAELLRQDPVARAQEQKRQRLMMFARKEWYEQWAEGEDLRGNKTYDSNMLPVDRIHIASTDFRMGRVWPPATSRVSYLWDQLRLYVGLLGSPPIWIRTDLQPPDTDVVDDDEYDSDASSPPRRHVLPQDDPEHDPTQGPQPKRKRIPPRTPYALHNISPIPLSSDAQVLTLLRLASARKEAKLLAFLAAPDTAIQIFLSWYIRAEGLIWSPIHLSALPRLVLFFLQFLVKVRALPESERQLRRAVDIAKRAVDECPKTGRLCRLLPDKVGNGGRGCWGVRWTEENNWRLDEESTEDAMRQFEEELKAENVELISTEKVVPEEEEDIRIQIMSPTSPGFVEGDTPSAFIGGMFDREPVHNVPNYAESETSAAFIDEVEKMDVTKREVETPATPVSINPPPPIPADTEDPTVWAWNTPTAPTPAQAQASLDAWFPPPTQPFMDILGMTVLPLQYEAGIAERSMRKVKGVLLPGQKPKSKDGTPAPADRKWRGVQEELVKRLARVVLEPWVGWDDGGVAGEYRAPRVQGDENGHDHGPLGDEITLLMEPRVAEQVVLGMGLAGTWVQLAPIRQERGESDSGRGGRGRGRGRGRGGPGGGAQKQKEFTFWYVEELHMAVPSFWMVGVEEEPLRMPEEGEDDEEEGVGGLDDFED